MPHPRAIVLTFLASWAALGSPRSLCARQTEPDSLRQRYRLAVPTPEQAAGVVVRPNPAFTPGAPTYEPGSFLLFYAGAAYTPRTRVNNAKHDGVGLVGVAFGNPSKWLGVQADVGLYSTARGAFFERMGLNVEVYRYLPGRFILAAGWENVLTRGNSDIGETQYGVLSRWISLRRSDQAFSAIGLSVGLGNGRRVSEADWLNDNTHDLNVFGGVTVQVAWPVAFVADWLGNDLTLGAAFTPLRGVPLVITPAVYDVTGQVEGTGAMFMISAVYAVRVK